jgi:hypothetical protein
LGLHGARARRRHQGDYGTAADLYNRAATILETYAATPTEGQLVELTMAQSTGEDISKKRRDLRTLYEQVMDGLAAVTRMRQRDQALLQALQKRKPKRWLAWSASPPKRT